MVALYRPGPMAFIPDYIERKKNPQKIRYLDPRMEEILKDSYGVITYQDDVLQIAIKIAGYTWLEADKLRRAMGKKIPIEMAAQKERFMRGCIGNNMRKETAQSLWEQIETFAAYGFGKAHAASYGNLAYKTAYMKANSPVDYMSPVLPADAGDVEKVALVVDECKRMGLQILPPSVNESQGNFTVVNPVRDLTKKDAGALAGDTRGSNGPSTGPATIGGAGDTSIRFGLYSIKNFGTGVADSIMNAVADGGSFSDVADFLRRVPDKNLNKKSLESLIKCGALDELAGGVSSGRLQANQQISWLGLPPQTAGVPADTRGKLLANIDLLLSFHREHADVPINQKSLFGTSAKSNAALKIPDSAPASTTERLAWEKELLGLYVSGHPLDAHKEKLAKQKTSIKDAKEKFPKGSETVIAGFLENLQYILTKNGERMVFGRLSDFSGSVEVVVFPRTLKENAALIVAGTCVMLKGKFTLRNGETSFAVEKVKKL